MHCDSLDTSEVMWQSCDAGKRSIGKTKGQKGEGAKMAQSPGTSEPQTCTRVQTHAAALTKPSARSQLILKVAYKIPMISIRICIFYQQA